MILQIVIALAALLSGVATPNQPETCLTQQQIDHLEAQAIGDYLTDTEVIIEDVP